MFASLVLLTLCICGIVGHRLDNSLFKPVLDLVGAEMPSGVELQNSDGDSLLSELRASDDCAGVPRRNAVGRKDLLQHLFAAYGCLSSVESLTKSKKNIDFEMLPNKGFDCKRYAPGMDELVSDVVPDNYAQNGFPSAAGRGIEQTVIVDKDSTMDNGFLNFPPISYYADFYKDLLIDTNRQETKRAGTAPVIGCDCKVKIDLVDLGQQHYPRYLMNAVCQNNHSPNEYPQKCWRGSYCKPLEYKVKVLTPRTLEDQTQNDPAMAWLPNELRQNWKFKTITVAAGCFCSY